jgi:hypothetical protein
MKKEANVSPSIRQIRRMQKPMWGRRPLSWALFTVLLLVCLILPSYSSMHPEQTSEFFESHPLIHHYVFKLLGMQSHRDYTNSTLAQNELANEKLAHLTTDTGKWQEEREKVPTYGATDKLWNPGHALDKAHQAWANDCKACHSEPFKQVQDKDCKGCHRDILDHVDTNIASVDTFKDAECAACHLDHNGLDGLSRQNKSYMASNCADCHDDIKKSFAKTKTEDVKDFADKHPEFRYIVAQSAKKGDLARVRIAKQSPLVEKTALKFPHDVHLDKDGVKSPKGKVDMNCASCHKPAADGLNFMPVTMKEDCQYCHDLKFEPAVSNREVPHGSVEQVLSTLREFYSYVQVNAVPVDENPLTPVINLVRPGEDEPKVNSFIRSNGNARERAAMSANELFEKTSCKLCHAITKLSANGKQGTPGQDLPQWDVAKLTPRHAWLTSSQFDHAKHRLADCTDCHQADKSKESSDVLMPTIETCRDCHAGSQHTSNKLVSDCGMCHGFHAVSGIHEKQDSDKTSGKIKSAQGE